MAASHRYVLHGVSIASDIVLPDLCSDAAQSAPQVCIETGAVPASLPGNTVVADERLQCDGSRLLLTVPDVGRFLITGHQILVSPAAGADPEALQSVLLGSAWAACCHQRGQLLLHASAARVGGRCVAFLGNSGAGKSTLAALLVERGHCIAADDTCVLASTTGRTLLYPGSRSIKLWRDALPLLAAHASEVRDAPRQPGKFKVSITPGWLDQPQPVHHLLLLGSDADGTPARFERLASLDSVRALTEHTFRPRFLALLARHQQNFMLCAAVSANTAVYRWIRPWGAQRQQQMVAMLEDWLESHSTAEAACMSSHPRLECPAPRML